MNWEGHIGKRYTFTGVFACVQTGHMLLEDVRRTDGVLFRDHLFVPFTRRFKRLDLREGDVLRLSGKVNRYFKKGRHQWDVPRFRCELSPDLEITNISVIGKE